MDEKEDGEEVIMAGLVVSIKEITTRNGDRMAFIGFEDKEGRTEVVVFPDVYREHHLIFAMDEPILIRGTVATDASNDSKKILANEAATLYEGLKKKAYKVVVKIPDSVQVSTLAMLKELTQNHPGELPLVIKVVNHNYEVTIDTGSYVDNAFVSEVSKINGVKTILQEVTNGKAVAV